MKNEEEIYSEWIRRRQSVPMPEGFAERVMCEIKAQPTVKRFDLTGVYRVLSSRPMQWAAAAGALMLGLFRLSYVTSALLIP